MISRSPTNRYSRSSASCGSVCRTCGGIVDDRNGVRIPAVDGQLHVHRILVHDRRLQLRAVRAAEYRREQALDHRARLRSDDVADFCVGSFLLNQLSERALILVDLFGRRFLGQGRQRPLQADMEIDVFLEPIGHRGECLRVIRTQGSNDALVGRGCDRRFGRGRWRFGFLRSCARADAQGCCDDDGDGRERHTVHCSKHSSTAPRLYSAAIRSSSSFTRPRHPSSICRRPIY